LATLRQTKPNGIIKLNTPTRILIVITQTLMVLRRQKVTLIHDAQLHETLSKHLLIGLPSLLTVLLDRQASISIGIGGWVVVLAID
jgi:hypothetical protein